MATSLRALVDSRLLVWVGKTMARIDRKLEPVRCLDKEAVRQRKSMYALCNSERDVGVTECMATALVVRSSQPSLSRSMTKTTSHG